MSESILYYIMFSLTTAYRKLEDIDALCYIKHSSTAKIVPKGPTSEWHGRKDDDDNEIQLHCTCKAICQFTTLLELSGNNDIYTYHLQSHQKQFLGDFVRLDLAC